MARLNSGPEIGDVVEYIGFNRNLTAAPLKTNSLRPRHLAELVLLSLLWGSAYLLTRSAVPEFGPAPLIALRMGIAVLVLLPILAWRGGLPVLRQHWKIMVLQGTLFTSLSFLLIAWSALSLSAGLTAILSATAPMFGAVIAWLFLRESIRGWRVAGLLLGMLGVTILVWGKVSLRGDADSFRITLAVLAGLASSLLWGFAANYSRRQLGKIDSLALTTGTMLSAALFLAPFAWWHWQGTAAPAAAPSLRAWAEAIFLGVLCSGLGMLMYFRLLREIGTVPTMSVTFMSPVVAIVLGSLYLNEPVTAQIIAGCAVVLAGTSLSVGLWPRPARET